MRRNESQKVGHFSQVQDYFLYYVFLELDLEGEILGNDACTALTTWNKNVHEAKWTHEYLVLFSYGPLEHF